MLCFMENIINSRGLLSGYFVVDTGYWLGRSSLQKGWKYQDEANNLNNRRQISMFCWRTAEICHGAVNFTVLLTPPTQWMENEKHFWKVGFIQRVLAKVSISNHTNIVLKLSPINYNNKPFEFIYSQVPTKRVGFLPYSISKFSTLLVYLGLLIYEICSK